MSLGKFELICSSVSTVRDLHFIIPQLQIKFTSSSFNSWSMELKLGLWLAIYGPTMHPKFEPFWLIFVFEHFGARLECFKVVLVRIVL